MPTEIVIKGLDMNAVNTLIKLSTILLNFSIILVGIYAIMLVGTILIGVLGD